jgi:hypothetical protein
MAQPTKTDTVLMQKDKIESDKGKLIITISSDTQKKSMRLDFNTPVSWIEFYRIDAHDFAAAFMGHIKRLQVK